MNICVVPSTKKEFNHDYIGIPRKLREHLGLEFGDSVRIDKNKVLHVVNPLPEDVGIFGETVATVSSQLSQGISGTVGFEHLIPTTITVGCDPEYLLLDKGNSVVDASLILGKNDMIGSDSELAEFRPFPSDSSKGLVENIRSLIRGLPTKTKHEPAAMSYYRGYVTGFHVHISLPQSLLLFAAKNTAEFIRNMVTVLDYYVGIPAMLGDNTDSRRLSKCGYGRPGDFRLGDCTIEYRTPGGYYLRHPALAQSLIETVRTVVEDVIGRATLLTKCWTKMGNMFSFEQFQSIYQIPEKKYIHSLLLNADRRYAEAELERVYKQLAIFYGYKENSKCINRLFFPPKNLPPFLYPNWLGVPDETNQR